MIQRRSNRTANQALVREINLAAIMQHLHQDAPISRSTLADRTGLNKTTVSSLVQELISYRLVREVGLDATRAGRPAMLLELDPAAGYIISCEIGGDFVLVICTNFATETIWRHKTPFDPHQDRETILQHTLTLLKHALAAGREQSTSLLGVAVGVPGLVDFESGLLLFAPNLNWQEIPLQQFLQDTLGTPVLVDNEANLAALGEYTFGAARHHNEILYLSTGVGLGGSIVRHGQVVRGPTGFAGEFGHMTMDPNGELCNCGNRGCWETQVSQAALFRLICRAIETGQASLLTDLTGGDLSRLRVRLVVEAAQAGDLVALAALEQVGHYLGIGIASLINALNPELVVIGGILSLAGDYLFPALEAEVARRTLRWNQRATAITLAHHGVDAAVMGGVATVFQAVLADPAAIAHRSRSAP